MTDTQQLVVQIYAKRYAQLWLEFDGIVQDLERARFYDLVREYPLCLNPKLGLRPKLIRTRWGVLFA